MKRWIIGLGLATTVAAVAAQENALEAIQLYRDNVFPDLSEATDMSRIQEMKLNPKGVHVIRTRLDATTTVEFPDAIELMDGRGMVANPTTNRGSFQLGFEPGSRLFSVRPLADPASTNLNVMVGDTVYVLVLTTDSKNYAFKVSLVTEGEDEITKKAKLEVKAKPASPSRLLSLLDQCKGYDFLKKFKPDSVSGIDHASPDTKFGAGNIEGVLTDVFRDHSLDTVVFRLALAVKKDGSISRKALYDPERLACRVGEKRYTLSMMSGSGEVVDGNENVAWFAITGDGFGGRNDLGVVNDFAIELTSLPGKFEQRPIAEVEPISNSTPKRKAPNTNGGELEAHPTIKNSKRYRVGGGETMQGVADRFQLTTGELYAVNGMKPGTPLTEGAWITIPARVAGADGQIVIPIK